MGNKSTTSSNYPPHDNLADKNCQELMMERWIQIHYQIKEREEAVQLARTRELFYWLSGFYAISIFSTIWYYKRFKRPETILPILPLTFVVGYYADIAYGSKLNRIKAEANMIMEHESELLHWPGGVPTLATIDGARFEAEIEKKLHPHHS